MKSLRITHSITDRQDASLRIFFKDVSKIPMIDINKEIELAKQAKAGDKTAANELVKANLRFVISVAKQYQNKGLPLVDLIQEGCLGIIKASQLYDESKGFRFISYAVWWIRQAIIQALSDQSRTVRVPMNQIVAINKINKVSNKLEQEIGRRPSSEEISLETNLNPNKIDQTIISVNKAISLDTAFKDDDSDCLLDVIPNKNSEDTDNISIQKDISNQLEEIINKLSYRERDIIKMIFGIGMNSMQNEEVANRFGISCERVRQIQHEALENLRQYKNELKELL